MSGILLPILIAFLSMFIPGILLAFALLRKTELHVFEIVVTGFIFGLIAPATLTWIESFLISYSSLFSFSVSLFELNSVALSIIGAVLCYQQGVFKDFIAWAAAFNKASDQQHQAPAPSAHKKHAAWWVWALLLALMLLTFYTRIINIPTAPQFFEFDPYFDMMAAQSILVYGQQFYLMPSAWPVVASGTVMRVQPLLPYLEAYWYELANMFGPGYNSFSTSLMSYVGSFYPPITAALLIFAIFVLLYHEYDPYIGLIGAALTAAMPVVITTFIAGEQLLEPWGIFSLFFFFAAYMLAIRNMKSVRLAVFAGIAFASTFLGAHYYTVDAGILAIYIVVQGLIDLIRDGKIKSEFYQMNGIVIIVIAIFLALYDPYNATLSGRIPSLLGIPTTVSFALFSLVGIAVLELAIRELPELLHVNIGGNNGVAGIRVSGPVFRVSVILISLIIVAAVIFLTPLGAPIAAYFNLSVKFTTPSSALFMTVEEYVPTGLFYDFGSCGALGVIASGLVINNASCPNLQVIPILVIPIVVISIILILVSIIYRNSKTAILYISIAVPLLAAGFSEVKYVPHMGIAYVMLFSIMLGELIYLSKIKFNLKAEPSSSLHELGITSDAYSHGHGFIFAYAMIAVGLFFFMPVLALAFLAYILISNQNLGDGKQYLGALLAVFIALMVVGLVSNTPGMVEGESVSFLQIIGASSSYYPNPTLACTSSSTDTYTITSGLGASLFCNTVQPYWLLAMKWINSNVGPYGPRVLAWWDYGDWINWFGNSNAVLRGDNSVPKEDYAVAATYVLGAADGYTPGTLANLMNTNQTKYVLFDQDLISKWGALDFLGCVNVNETSRSQAIAEAKIQGSSQPFLLGFSQCEINHDPQDLLVPYCAVAPQAKGCSLQSLNYYCSISTPNVTYLRAFLLTGQSASNQSVCLDANPNAQGVLSIYNSSGQKMNAVVQTSLDLGLVNIGNVTFLDFPMIYLPNGPNGTITNAPTQYYDSNFYKAFFLGSLPGFTQVYPENATGVNFVNGTYSVRIFKLDNYTGGNVSVPQKPAYVHNNYTMP